MCEISRIIHSISKAARAHELSQSAASQALSELERELEIEFFDRRRRPLDITPAGKIYLDYCREVLRKEDELKAALAQLKKHVDGTVRVAAIYSVGLSEMSQIEARFEERFPDAELQVQYLAAGASLGSDSAGSSRLGFDELCRIFA